MSTTRSRVAFQDRVRAYSNIPRATQMGMADFLRAGKKRAQEVYEARCYINFLNNCSLKFRNEFPELSFAPLQDVQQWIKILSKARVWEIAKNSTARTFLKKVASDLAEVLGIPESEQLGEEMVDPMASVVGPY